MAHAGFLLMIVVSPIIGILAIAGIRVEVLRERWSPRTGRRLAMLVSVLIGLGVVVGIYGIT